MSNVLPVRCLITCFTGSCTLSLKCHFQSSPRNFRFFLSFTRPRRAQISQALRSHPYNTLRINDTHRIYLSPPYVPRKMISEQSAPPLHPRSAEPTTGDPARRPLNVRHRPSPVPSSQPRPALLALSIHAFHAPPSTLGTTSCLPGPRHRRVRHQSSIRVPESTQAQGALAATLLNK